MPSGKFDKESLDALKRAGFKGTIQEFRSLVYSRFVSFQSSNPEIATYEDLLTRPEMAIRFCDTVKFTVHNRVILKALITHYKGRRQCQKKSK